MSDQPATPAPDKPDGPASRDLAEPREMTAEELDEARRYRRANLRVTLVDIVLDVVYLAVAALILARPLDAWLAGLPWLGSYWLRLAALYLAVAGLHMAVSLPLSYYGGFVLEHRFQLSTLSRAGWAWRYAKRAALSILLVIGLVEGLFAIIHWTGPYWWLAAAGGFFLVSVVLGQLAPVLILPLFYRIERLDDAGLVARIHRLTEGTNLAIEGVYRIALSDETVKANAALAGLGRTRRVLLGDTLLDRFSLDEIAVVFAHEIGHHVFHHIPKQIASGLVFSAAGFWLCDHLLRLWLAGPTGQLDYAAMPVAALPMLLLILRLFSLVLEPVQNAVSRAYERQCDRYALARTGQPDAYRSAFRKLARLNKDDPDPPRLEVLLFHSHPPIQDRLALADR